MAKKKYVYVIVDKENGDILNCTDARLPIYWRKELAKAYMIVTERDPKKWLIHKIEIEKLINLIIHTPIKK